MNTQATFGAVAAQGRSLAGQFFLACAVILPAFASAEGHAQRASGPTASTPKVKASDQLALPAYVRPSPLRVERLAVTPDHIRAVKGAMLVVDHAEVAALAQLDSVRLMDFVLAPDLSVDVDLRRTDVFADDAVILASRIENGEVVSEPLPLTDAAIFVGKTVDDPDSIVAISVSEHGVQGFASRLGETFIISSGSSLDQNVPIAYRLDEAAAEALGLGEFHCAADEIPQPLAAPVESMGGVAGAPAPPCRIVRIALETDHEFLQSTFGGNHGAATAYAGTLIAGSSEVFKRDVNVRFQIVFLQLWVNSNDPWDQGSTSNQLGQFRDYWEANNDWIDRDVAHFLSGRFLGGGVAWLNALCEEDFDYALSANLVGSFPYPTLMQSDFNWDIVVVTHELGHNFGSPHTHSYAPPIDGCGNGDCTNANQGTLMSYCHQCPGGLANMNIRFHETCIARILDYLDNETLCDLSDTSGPPDPNNDFENVAANSANPIDVLRNDLSGDCEQPVIVSHDANSQMGGTIAISPGTGPEGRDELIYTPANGFTGNDQFFYWVGNGGQDIAGGQVKVNVLPLVTAEDHSCSESGVCVGYYVLSGPASMPNFAALAPYGGEILTQINFPSTDGDFAGSNRSDNVGAVFVGFLNLDTSGVYRLSVTSDDGSKVYLGDQLIINNDGLHGMAEVQTMLALEAGLHRLRVEFFENGGGAGLILAISGKNLPKAPVAASMLRHDGALLADFVSGETFAPPGDGTVDAADLAFLLGAWGNAVGSIADIVNNETFLPPVDGQVDGADLAYLLGAWGDCP